LADDLKIDDAIDFIARHLASKLQISPEPFAAQITSTWQFDIEVRHVANAFWQMRGIGLAGMPTKEARSLYGPFLDAAWYLCRIGVLRPGEVSPSEGLKGPGYTGDGFSVTAFGRLWLASAAERPPADAGRMMEILQPFSYKFGEGFLQRAAEASKCYGTCNYLASCSMAGAAAESILLAVAIAQTGNEGEVLSHYRSRSGRKELTKIVLRGRSPALAEKFLGLSGLVHYWRDETSHGMHTTVGETQAFLSLSQLIRFAQFASDNWPALTS
jgi:hypothetical protein